MEESRVDVKTGNDDEESLEVGILTFEVIQQTFTNGEGQELEDCGHVDYRSWCVVYVKDHWQGNIFPWNRRREKEENGQRYHCYFLIAFSSCRRMQIQHWNTRLNQFQRFFRKWRFIHALKWLSESSRGSSSRNSAEGVRVLGFSKHSATTESGVAVPKISCQEKVEAVKKIHQERDSGRNGEQRRVKGAPMSSCWDVGNIVKVLQHETRLQILGQGSGEVLVRGGRRCGNEVVLFWSGAQQFFFVIIDALAHLIFLFEMEHRRSRLKSKSKQNEEFSWMIWMMFLIERKFSVR